MYKELDGIIFEKTPEGLKSTDKIPCSCVVYCQIYSEEDIKNFKTCQISMVDLHVPGANGSKNPLRG